MTHTAANYVFGQDLDKRHHLVSVGLVGSVLTGFVELKHVAAAQRWAEEHGHQNATTQVSAIPAVGARRALLRSHPNKHATAVTEVLLGQPLELLRMDDSWAQVRTQDDRYIGWLRAKYLGTSDYRATHMFSGTRGHAYGAPRVQGEVLADLSWGARINVVDIHGAWTEVRLPDARTGFVRATLLTPLDEVKPVAILDSWSDFLGTPYRWGGMSAWGIDCSGFVQLLHRMAGTSIPRDSDEQAAGGMPVSSPKPGDVATFPGHVGIFLGEGRLVHSSGTKMRVTVDVLEKTPELNDSLQGFVRFGGTQ